MNSLLRIALPAMTALAFIGSAWADNPRKPLPTPDLEVVEARARDVVLPSDTLGTLVMKTCLQCPLKSYTVSAGTRYFLFNQPATLSDVRAAVAAAARPDAYVGVTYSPKSGEVSAVNAHARRVRP
jgi:hypothetical protein